MIKVIAIGQKSEYQSQINDYAKRLKKPYDIEWILLPYSKKSNDDARNDESKQILSKLKSTDYVILLDERGKQLDNYQLSKTLTSHHNTTIIIGGAYGVNEELRRRANMLISLSKLVLPHSIVRLVITEQIYRSQAILMHHPYHHE